MLTIHLQHTYITKISKLVHFSSDFIFDGSQDFPYSEDSVPNPLNAYGKQKIESENIMNSILGERGLTIRFASLITNSIKNSTFLEKEYLSNF